MKVDDSEQPSIRLWCEFRHLAVGKGFHRLIGIARVLEDLRCGGAGAPGPVDGGDFAAIREDDGLTLLHFYFLFHIRTRWRLLSSFELIVIDQYAREMIALLLVVNSHEGRTCEEDMN